MRTCIRPCARIASVPGISRRCIVACSCGGRPARIDDDQMPAGAALRVEVLHDRRHRLGDVGADEHHGVGAGDVGDGKRQAPIEAEGAQARRGG